MITVSNLDIINKKRKQIQDIKLSMDTYIIMYQMTLRDCITKSLADNLGKTAQHYDVKVESGGGMSHITITAIDDVGKFIYGGTITHGVQPTNAKALHFANGDFAMFANVPGMVSKKPQIDKAVRAGIDEAKLIMGSFKGVR